MGARRNVEGGDVGGGAASEGTAIAAPMVGGVPARLVSRTSTAKSLLHDSSDSDGEHSSGSVRQRPGPAVRPFRASERSRSSVSERQTSAEEQNDANTSVVAGGKQHPGAARYSGVSSSESSSSLVLPDVNNSMPTSTSHDHTLVDMLRMENDALKKKISSFEQQHRFMMSALDREYHLKVKEQERQRAVLNEELEDVLKQLKYGQLECKDKIEAAETQVAEERRKTAAAEKQRAQAQQQRNQLVTQVAALRAEISRRDSQSCFEDLSDILGHGAPDEPPPPGNCSNTSDSSKGMPHNIKPYTAQPQRPQTAHAAGQSGSTSHARYSDSQGLTRDQMGALRQHVTTLAKEKSSLLLQVASLQEKWEDAHERAGAAERLAAQLAIVRAEREAALALSTNILAGAFNSCPACRPSSQRQDASGPARPNAGAHKRPSGAAVKIPRVASGSTPLVPSDAQELVRLREESAALHQEVSVLRQQLKPLASSKCDVEPEPDISAHKPDAPPSTDGLECRAAGAVASAPTNRDADIRSQLSEALETLQEVRCELDAAVAQKARLQEQLDSLVARPAAAALSPVTKPTVAALVVADTSASAGEIEAEVLELREKLAAEQGQLAKAREMAGLLRKEAQQHAEEASRAGEECARLQQRFDVLESERRQQTHEDVSELQDELNYVTAERDTLKASNEELLLQFASAQEQLRAQTAGLAALQEKLEDRERSAREREGQLQRKQEELGLDELKAELQGLRGKLVEAEGQVVALQQELGENKAQVGELSGKLAAAEAEAAQSKTAAGGAGGGEESEMLRQELEVARSVLEEVRGRLAEAEGEAGALGEELEAEKKRRRSMEEEKAREAPVHAVLARLREEVSEERSSAESARREAAAVRRELEEEGKKVAAADERLRVMSQEMQLVPLLRSELDGEKIKVQALMKQLEELQAAGKGAEWGEAASGKAGGRPWSGQSSGRPSSGLLSSAQTPQLGQRPGSAAGSTSPAVQFHAQEPSAARSGRPSSASNARPSDSDLSRPPAGRGHPIRPASAHVAGKALSGAALSYTARHLDALPAPLTARSQGDEQAAADAPAEAQRETAPDGGDGAAVPDDGDDASLDLSAQGLAANAPLVRHTEVTGSLTAGIDESESESETSKDSMTDSEASERQGLTPPVRAPSAASAATKSDLESDGTRPGTPEVPPDLVGGDDAHVPRLHGDDGASSAERSLPALAPLPAGAGGTRVVPKLGLGLALSGEREELEERRARVEPSPRTERPSAASSYGRGGRDAFSLTSPGGLASGALSSPRPSSLAARTPVTPKERKQVSPMASASSAGLPAKSPSPGSEGRVSDVSQSSGKSDEDPVYEEDEDFVQEDAGDDLGLDDSFENAVDQAITYRTGAGGARPASAKNQRECASSLGGSGPI